MRDVSWRLASRFGALRSISAQELLWRKFFSDPTQWWDNRQTKGTPRHPDFRHRKSKEVLWVNKNKPAWVEPELARWDDAGTSRRPESTSVQGASGRVAATQEGGLDVGTCTKICEDGQVTEAVDALSLLVQQGCQVPNNLVYRVLKRCIGKDLLLGRRIHALSVQSGYEGDAFLATHLIALYASHGRLEEAVRVFSRVTPPDAYNWASIIFAHARHGEPGQAIKLYRDMQQSTVQSTNHIFVAVLKACATAGDLAAGKEVHAHVRASAVEPNIFVQNCLVDMYAKCGSLRDARTVFDHLCDKNVVTWNAMIAGYVQQGIAQEALSVYGAMQRQGKTPPNSVTFACLLRACASVGVGALSQGKHLHAQLDEQGVEPDVMVGASLVNMYAKCGSLEDARRVFDSLPRKDVVTWNTMIAGYAQQGMGQEALTLYTSMKHEGITPPDAFTFVCLLQACASMAALHHGKQLHAQLEERGLQADVVVGSSLVDMYAKCGSLEDAHRVFDTLSQKDVVTWTVLIAGYAQQGMGEEAVALYSSMQQEGVTPPDSVTFVCLLQACASLAALPLGKQLHAQIQEQGLQTDAVVGCSLVNMYAKCGGLQDAQHVFDSLPEKDMEAWGALVAGYSRQGDSEVVFDLLHRMRQQGIQPDSITFLSVLTVCSHVGLVDKARSYFESMQRDYGICPSIQHCTCMVDVLGRAGHLDEALHMVKTMPFQPSAAVWLTLLGACQKWSNAEVGRQAFEFAVRLNETDAAAYVLMSNIYVGAKMWEKAKEMHARRVKCGAWKDPGQTWWTDMGGEVHAFGVGDRKSFPQSVL